MLQLSLEQQELIRQYLTKSGYAHHVIDGGVRGLLSAWDWTIQRDLGSPHYEWEEYLNDPDGRRILEEVIQLVDEKAQKEIRDELTLLDTQFLEKTEARACVVGDYVAQKRHWNAQTHWWYYRKLKTQNIAPSSKTGTLM